MPTQDGFDPPHHLPQFLVDRAEPDIRNAPDREIGSSRMLKAGILITAVVATGIAILAVGNPMTLLAEMSASLAGSSPPASAPAVQIVDDAPVPVTSVAQAPPPIAQDTPAREEIAASAPAGKDQAEKTEPTSETLFSQFQAWAAEQDAQARGGPAQPVQDAPAQVTQNVPPPAAETVRAPYRLAQKRRHIRAVQNARAEVRQQSRRQVRRAQSASAERPPAQEARAQDPRAQDAAVQNTQTPSFLQPIFGPRN